MGEMAVNVISDVLDGKELEILSLQKMYLLQMIMWHS